MPQSGQWAFEPRWWLTQTTARMKSIIEEGFIGSSPILTKLNARCLGFPLWKEDNLTCIFYICSAVNFVCLARCAKRNRHWSVDKIQHRTDLQSSRFQQESRWASPTFLPSTNFQRSQECLKTLVEWMRKNYDTVWKNCWQGGCHASYGIADCPYVHETKCQMRQLQNCRK